MDRYFPLTDKEAGVLAPYCARVGQTQVWPQVMLDRFRRGEVDGDDCMRVLARLSVSMWWAQAGFDDATIIRWIRNGKYDAFKDPAPTSAPAPQDPAPTSAPAPQDPAPTSAPAPQDPEPVPKDAATPAHAPAVDRALTPCAPSPAATPEPGGTPADSDVEPTLADSPARTPATVIAESDSDDDDRAAKKQRT